MPLELSSNTRGGAFLTHAQDRIFSVEEFQGDESLMVRTAEQFSRSEIIPIQEKIETQEDGLMPELVRKAGELGFCGADGPEVYGGLGLSKNLAARMLEFLSLNGSFSVTIGITSGISQVGLSLFGTDSLKSKYLPPLTSGEQIGAYALSEPNSGSDALSMTTSAIEKNGKWVLNGTKMWISNAKWADQFLVMAKVGGEKVSAFLVERDFPGVAVAREEYKMGLKGSSTARVLLEDAEVPLENLLHLEGKGHQVAFNALNLGRFKLSSMSIGPAREAIFVAAQYAQERRQFGQPISNFGLIRKKLADMAAWFYIAESVTYRTGALVDGAFALYGGTVDGNISAASEYAVECSASKVISTEMEGRIVDEALQIFGGYGFTEEFPIARIFRDARVSRIYEGTNEINRIFLADRLAKAICAHQDQFPTPTTQIQEFALNAYTAFLNLHDGNQFGKSVDQVSLGALSDLAMAHYAAQSCELRARQTSGINQMVNSHAQNMLLSWAAASYQGLMGETVTISKPRDVDLHAIAEAVLARTLPCPA